MLLLLVLVVALAGGCPSGGNLLGPQRPVGRSSSATPPASGSRASCATCRTAPPGDDLSAPRGRLAGGGPPLVPKQRRRGPPARPGDRLLRRRAFYQGHPVRHRRPARPVLPGSRRCGSTAPTGRSAAPPAPPSSCSTWKSAPPRQGPGRRGRGPGLPLCQRAGRTDRPRPQPEGVSMAHRRGAQGVRLHHRGATAAGPGGPEAKPQPPSGAKIARTWALSPSARSWRPWARRMGLPVVDLATYEVDTDAVGKMQAVGPAPRGHRRGPAGRPPGGGHQRPLNFYGTRRCAPDARPAGGLGAGRAPSTRPSPTTPRSGPSPAPSGPTRTWSPCPHLPHRGGGGEGDAPVVKLLASLLDRGYNSGGQRHPTSSPLSSRPRADAAGLG